jgi:hypothetical protein
MSVMLLATAFHAYTIGEMRAGTSPFAPYLPNRNDNPLAFNCPLLMYFCGGLALCVWELLGMIGMAPTPKGAFHSRRWRLCASWLSCAKQASASGLKPHLAATPVPYATVESGAFKRRYCL